MSAEDREDMTELKLYQEMISDNVTPGGVHGCNHKTILYLIFTKFYKNGTNVSQISQQCVWPIYIFTLNALRKGHDLSSFTNIFSFVDLVVLKMYVITI